MFSTDQGFEANLAGFRPLPDGWAFDWKFFFGSITRRPNKDKDQDPPYPQPSYKIDPLLSAPLTVLSKVGVVEQGPSSLAERNLMRGMNRGLPSGQAVADLMGTDQVPEKELFATVKLKHADDQILGRQQRETPLWYYILREAEYFESSERLGPVGGRIVAEVFLGILFGDKSSFVNVAPTWHPSIGNKQGFDMQDFIAFGSSGSQ